MIFLSLIFESSVGYVLSRIMRLDLFSCVKRAERRCGETAGVNFRVFLELGSNCSLRMSVKSEFLFISLKLQRFYLIKTAYD